MKTTELRIGNFISINFGNCDDGKVITVNGVSDCEIYNEEHGYSPCNEFKPIPLTEQWLLDFGFVKKHVDFRTRSNPTAYNGGILKLSDFTVYLDKSEIEWAYRATVLDAPKYVHQLQNLYFALIQEELILKEK